MKNMYSEMLINSLQVPGPNRHNIHLQSIVSLLKDCLREYLEHVYDECIVSIAKKCYLTNVDKGHILFRQDSTYGAIHILFDGIAHEKRMSNNIEDSGNHLHDTIDRNLNVGSVIGANIAVSNMTEFPSTVKVISDHGARCCSIPHYLFVCTIGLAIFDIKNSVKDLMGNHLLERGNPTFAEIRASAPPLVMSPPDSIKGDPPTGNAHTFVSSRGSSMHVSFDVVRTP